MEKVNTGNLSMYNLEERFLGEYESIFSVEETTINANVYLKRLSVIYNDANKPEETGKLICLPVDDNRFCVYICGLMYPGPSQHQANISVLRYEPGFFDQFAIGILSAYPPFSYDRSAELLLPVCAKTWSQLEKLQNRQGITAMLNTLQMTQSAINILFFALECALTPAAECQVPACRFLTNDLERSKINEAVQMINHSTDQNFTIRQLAKKVAMNECYLKKGFKAVTGKTINEYQQDIKMEKAKAMLQTEGATVTNVAALLGFSSISHFSTVFRRTTGMKPCELLG